MWKEWESDVEADCPSIADCDGTAFGEGELEDQLLENSISYEFYGDGVQDGSMSDDRYSLRVGMLLDELLGFCRVMLAHPPKPRIFLDPLP